MDIISWIDPGIQLRSIWTMKKHKKAIYEPLFKRLKTVEKDLYELELLKSTIEHREPIIFWLFRTSVCKAENAGALL